MDKIIELLLKLKIKIADKWQLRSQYDNKIHYYCGFRHKGKDYCVSTSGLSYIFSKLEKGKSIPVFIYEGYSFNDLEDSIKKEVGYEGIQN